MRVAKKISVIFLFYFILLLLFFIVAMISVNSSMNKYGGEISDGYGLIILFITTLISLIFIFWTFKIYKGQQNSSSTYLQLGLIFLFGILGPFIFVSMLMTRG
jgi:hypothetical protein